MGEVRPGSGQAVRHRRAACAPDRARTTVAGQGLVPSTETVADKFEEAAGDRSGDQDLDAEVRHPGTGDDIKDAGEKVRDKAERLRENIEVDE